MEGQVAVADPADQEGVAVRVAMVDT